MNLPKKYPKLFTKLEDDTLSLRHLLNVDENYEDFDSEEYEFEVDEYNYVIYISELTQNALGEEKMQKLMLTLHDRDEIENFLATEPDLYGIKTTLEKSEIELIVLDIVEGIV